MTKTILILTANPKDTLPLRLDQEVREIGNGLQRAKRRDDFILKQVWAVRRKDFRRAMLDFMPNIVHFCGHGSGDEGIAFENENGRAELVGTNALSDFFALFSDKVQCVVLNACFSEIQAEAIAEHIPFVVGMKKAIGDIAAIEFAVSFYDAIGAGETIEFAFKLGCNAIHLSGLSEELTPVLKSKRHITSGNSDFINSDLDEIKIGITNRFTLDECFVLQREQDNMCNYLELGTSVAIIGESGSGKTTLLHKLSHLAQFKVGYLNLEHKEIQYTSALLRQVILVLTDSDPGEIQHFRQLEEKLLPDKKYVLCLDNLDSLISSPTFDPILLDYFRSFTQGGGLIKGGSFSIVITSKLPLETLISWKKSPTSPWFNLYHFISLNGLSELRMRKLLNGAGIVLPEQINFCYETARKLLPFDLLVLAYYIKLCSPNTINSYDIIRQKYRNVVSYLERIN